MQAPQQTSCRRYWGFFLINLSHDTLINFYRTNYQLMQNHKYSLTDINDMMPWEREVYVTMLIEDLKEQEELRKQQQR
jgi:hypothetical protein